MVLIGEEYKIVQSSLNLELTQDIPTIKKVLLELWDETTTDEVQNSKEHLDELIYYSFKDDIYFKVSVENELAGIIHYEFLDTGIYDPHMNMLPSYRGTIAIEAAQKSLQYIKNITGCHTLRIYVPTCYPNVQKFADLFKFKQIEVLKNTWLKKGIWYDTVVSELELT